MTPHDMHVPDMLLRQCRPGPARRLPPHISPAFVLEHTSVKCLPYHLLPQPPQVPTAAACRVDHMSAPLSTARPMASEVICCAQVCSILRPYLSSGRVTSVTATSLPAAAMLGQQSSRQYRDAVSSCATIQRLVQPGLSETLQ